MATSMLIPIIIHYSVFKEEMSGGQILFHVILILFSGTIMCTATFFSFKELISKVRA